jgi:L-2-hydroxyglutarate oxidase LhgO
LNSAHYKAIGAPRFAGKAFWQKHYNAPFQAALKALNSMEKIGAVVIGAGVVGLACARALAQRGIDTIILERHDAFGTETSARNSEVIHAGLYYPAGSLKAQLCVAGRHLLYDFCTTHGVSHRRCGKLIVATTHEQESRLDALRQQGQLNGVDDLQPLTAAQAVALEPALQCSAALLSPSTGIVDSHGLMLALLGDAERSGASLAVCSPLLGGAIEDNGIVLEIGGQEAMRFKAGIVINAAGLSAVKVAASLTGFPAAQLPTAFYAKGNYYALAGRSPFLRLIYPLPEPGGLGVHLTLDLGGQARFGPDVEWLKNTLNNPGNEPDYSVDPARANGFYAEVRHYWPGLPDHALIPAYAGIRPKISGSNEPAADFMIQGPEAHGITRLINLFGIESPGLTSSLAIAALVVEKLHLD